jgi:hypothetical protein
MPVAFIDDEEKQLRMQLAQFSFDMFIHAYSRHCADKEVLAQTFDDLTDAQKFAWEQSAWALKDLVKMKSSEFDRISKQNDDVGYMVYNGVKTIMKLHTGIVTYKKFSEIIKTEYRELAFRIRFKLEDDETGD